MTDIFCPIINGGLQINLKMGGTPMINNCCLRSDLRPMTENYWNNSSFIPLRELNRKNIWDDGCWTCRGNELDGLESFRTGMLKKFGRKSNLSGPQRLDLMFDISCNLACRTCGPHSSTFWQRHLIQNKITFNAPPPESKVEEMIDILETLDLSNLEMVVFCGGETLMGTGYWKVAEAIQKMTSHAKEKIVLCFQTNGTQLVPEKYFELIEKYHLVKLHISLDGMDKRFEYLRWPAKWDQVKENIFNLANTLPTNCMFLVEETISIFNLFYLHELKNWLNNNFSKNRLGDTVNHTHHVAHGPYSINYITKEYYDNLSQHKELIPNNWSENHQSIRDMIAEIKKYDELRGQSFEKTFPEVASFYSRYL